MTDVDLLASVRAGDSSAYAVLYELHAESVRRLARRLCRDQHEADDVVSDVFANTLRAIQNGGGPRDEFVLYALRSVRNTVTKLRTRTDTARATPSEFEVLDRPDADDPFYLTGDVEQAFAELPERFQQVLWTTAVEGHTPAELAATGAGGASGLDSGAVATLSQRARKAFGRSYLQVRTRRPARHPECNRVRNYLPGYVQHTAGAGTAQRIEAHLAHCADCTQVRDEMRELNGKLRTTPWLALLAAAVRRVVTGIATAGAPVAATAAAPVVAIAIAGTMIAQQHRDTDGAGAGAAIEAVYAAADELPAPVPGAARRGPIPGAAAGPHGSGAPGDQPDDTGVVPPDAAVPVPGSTPTGEPTMPLDGPVGTPLDGPAGTPIDGPNTGAVPTLPPLDGLPTEVPGIPGLPTPGPANTSGVVGSVTGGVANGVLVPVTDGVGTLIDDVNGTLTDVGNVVGALPNGLPAAVTATGELLNGVGDTVNNTLNTAGNVVNGATGTVSTTVTTVVATVDQTVTDVTGNVGAIVDIDPDAPVNDLVNDVIGAGGLVGEGGTVDNLLDGLGLGGSSGSSGSGTPSCTLLCLGN